MRKEQRSAERVKANLTSRWEGVLTQCEGIISDISTNGCFVMTSGNAAPGELVRVEMRLPTGEWLCLWGEVVDQAYDIGFAMRFTGGSDGEEKLLAQFIEQKLSRRG